MGGDFAQLAMLSGVVVPLQMRLEGFFGIIITAESEPLDYLALHDAVKGFDIGVFLWVGNVSKLLPGLRNLQKLLCVIGYELLYHRYFRLIVNEFFLKAHF